MRRRDLERPAAADGSGVIALGIMEILAVALAVAGGISTIAGAGNWIVRLIRVLKAPNSEQDRRLADLEAHMREVDGFLANDRKRLDGIDASTRVSQRALLALLAHGIDGNHRHQMEEAKKELELHLIRK